MTQRVDTSAQKVSFTVCTSKFPSDSTHPGIWERRAQQDWHVPREGPLIWTEEPGDDGGLAQVNFASLKCGRTTTPTPADQRGTGSRHSCFSSRCSQTSSPTHWDSTSPGLKTKHKARAGVLRTSGGDSQELVPEASTVTYLGRAQGPCKGSQGQHRVSGAASTMADVRGLGRLV